MVHARGVAFLGCVQFVRHTYGAEAHERVLAALDDRQRAAFLGTIREASWKPLKAMVSYVEAAKSLFGAKDPDFYRKLGRHIGMVERQWGGFQPMVVEPATAMRLTPVIWKALYDAGRMEFVPEGPLAGLARLHAFRTSPELCAANCGGFEGLMSTDDLALEVDELACAARGGRCCEYRLVWKRR